jgi:hypothetical protein
LGNGALRPGREANHCVALKFASRLCNPGCEWSEAEPGRIGELPGD